MEERNKRKEMVGIVVSDKMDKTISIAVERKTQHPLYKRVIKKTSTFKAHDGENQCKVGDKVRVMETRPLSKTKRWRVVNIIEKAE